MSVTQRVTSPTFGPAATNRIASSGRNVATVSYQRVDDLSGSNAMGPQEQSVRYDDGYQPPGQGGRRESGARRQTYADFASYAQVDHLNDVIFHSSWPAASLPFPVEVMRGVGRYESNMRVIAGMDRVGGETYNRLF